MTLAAASEPATPRIAKSLAPIRSPPICAAGSSTLTASRTNRSRTHVRRSGRSFGGNSIHHPAPARETVATRTITTSAIPHPTLATAWPTASMPDHMIRPMTAAIPINQAIMPARLTIPIRAQDVVDMTRRADAALLPRLLEVKGVGRAQPESPLAGRTTLHDERRIGSIAGEPLELDKGVGRPLRIPGVACLGAGTDRTDAPFSGEYREAGGRRLRRIDAEIGARRRLAGE